jgi:hypothetical protein
MQYMSTAFTIRVEDDFLALVKHHASLADETLTTYVRTALDMRMNPRVVGQADEDPEVRSEREVVDGLIAGRTEVPRETTIGERMHPGPIPPPPSNPVAPPPPSFQRLKETLATKTNTKRHALSCKCHTCQPPKEKSGKD